MADTSSLETCCCQHNALSTVQTVPQHRGTSRMVTFRDSQGQARRLKIIDPHYRLGMHVELRTSLFQTVNRLAPAHKVLQFFLNPRNGIRVATISQHDRMRTREWLDRWQHSFYIHCPVRLNLARPLGDSYLTACMGIVRKLTQTVYDLPAGCVLHIGNGKRGGGLSDVANRINDLRLPTNPHPYSDTVLYLENAAGKGNDLGVTWDDIRRLYEAIDNPSVGLCLDTQHLFGSGQCDFQNQESVVELFDQVEAVGPKLRPIFHLNDSLVPLRSRKDRHASIGQGYIWSALANNGHLDQDQDQKYIGSKVIPEEQESLAYLLERCREQRIDLILETKTPEGDITWLNRKFL